MIGYAMDTSDIFLCLTFIQHVVRHVNQNSKLKILMIELYWYTGFILMKFIIHHIILIMQYYLNIIQDLFLNMSILTLSICKKRLQI